MGLKKANRKKANRRKANRKQVQRLAEKETQNTNVQPRPVSRITEYKIPCITRGCDWKTTSTDKDLKFLCDKCVMVRAGKAKQKRTEKAKPNQNAQPESELSPMLERYLQKLEESQKTTKKAQKGH